MPGQRLVDRVVGNLEHHVVEARAVVGVADVHAGPLAHRVEALEDLDALGVVAVRCCGRCCREFSGSVAIVQDIGIFRREVTRVRVTRVRVQALRGVCGAQPLLAVSSPDGPRRPRNGRLPPARLRAGAPNGRRRDADGAAGRRCGSAAAGRRRADRPCTAGAKRFCCGTGAGLRRLSASAFDAKSAGQRSRRRSSGGSAARCRAAAPRSSGAQKAIAMPAAPARAVRPMRWTYCSGTSGKS